jgi:DNA-binding response OmpR family regulator
MSRQPGPIERTLESQRRRRTPGLVVLAMPEGPLRQALQWRLRLERYLALCADSIDMLEKALREVRPDQVVIDVDSWSDGLGQRTGSLLHRMAVDGTAVMAIGDPSARRVSDQRDTGAIEAASAVRWISKPVRPVQLVEQIRASGPRGVGGSAGDSASGTVKVGRLRWHAHRRQLDVWCDGRWRPVDLTALEHRVVGCLMAAPVVARSRHEIVAAAWPSGGVALRTVDQCVRRLRQALQPMGAASCIRTVPGFGYRVDDDAVRPQPPPAQRAASPARPAVTTS